MKKPKPTKRERAMPVAKAVRMPMGFMQAPSFDAPDHVHTEHDENNNAELSHDPQNAF